jgi:Uma2 family endonuclease
MSVPHPNVRFRYDDYQSLPGPADRRYELLDGDILMVPVPTTVHQRIARNLEYLLIGICRRHDLGVIFHSPVDVVFGQGKDREIVEPDIVFISKARMEMIELKEIRGDPDLVVEILSAGTEDRDRGYKRVLYGRYGVREYWVIDPEETRVEVYRHHEGGLTLAATLGTGDILSSPLLANVAISLAEVFAPDS